MVLTKIAAEFKPHKIGLRKVLGDLEADIMEVVWAKEHATVREVYEQLRLQREIAYTTVMTIMGRLNEKNLLEKHPQGNAYIYSPTVSRLEFTKKIVKEVLDGLFDEFAEPAMNHLVDRLSKEKSNDIDTLEELIKQKRVEGGK
ncbi:MAG: BlaI/MecI/CopY family transcriptional regulator [Clostridia bacterium]|nr:BlaI/MecI/CopY family transcriptional regulator [Clostridia bacterium]